MKNCEQLGPKVKNYGVTCYINASEAIGDEQQNTILAHVPNPKVYTHQKM